MARYLIIIMLAVVAACSLSSSIAERDPAYPETRSDRVTLSTVHSSGDTVAPGAQQFGLSTFARYASVTDGEKARAGAFEVLYLAPNRDPALAVPYQPASVRDRVLLMMGGEVLAEELIPAEFAGTGAARKLDVAQLDAGGKRFLLVTTGSEAGQPLWLAIFTTKGKLVYRAALEHGGYHFVEHADGLSMLDDTGQGKRITLL